VGVAYFGEIDTDMTSRGFGTEASAKLLGRNQVLRPAPLESAVVALERGIARRSRRVAAPWWAAGLLPLTVGLQPAIERMFERRLPRALEIARTEDAPLTTPQSRSAR
jgi:hypothetical protein